MELPFEVTSATFTVKKYAHIALMMSSSLMMIFWINFANRKRVWLLTMVNLMNIFGILSLIFLDTDWETGKSLYMIFIPLHVVGFLMNVVLNYEVFRNNFGLNNVSQEVAPAYMNVDANDNLHLMPIRSAHVFRLPDFLTSANSDINDQEPISN